MIDAYVTCFPIWQILTTSAEYDLLLTHFQVGKLDLLPFYRPIFHWASSLLDDEPTNNSETNVLLTNVIWGSGKVFITCVDGWNTTMRVSGYS